MLNPVYTAVSNNGLKRTYAIQVVTIENYGPHYIQLIKPSQVFASPTGIQTLSLPVNLIIIISLCSLLCTLIIASQKVS